MIELNHASVVGLGCEGNVIGKSLKEISEINRDQVGEGIEDFVRKVMRENKRRELALNTVFISCGVPVQQVTGSVSPLLN